MQTCSFGRRIFGPLDLDPVAALAVCDGCSVFQHPSSSNLLIKIGQRGSILRELNEYIIAAALPGHVREVPLARVLGLARTSLGIGLVVEKIDDGHGALAPALGKVVAQHGRLAQIEAQLQAFFDALSSAHLVVNTISPTSIVYGFNAGGRPGIYMVAGYGVTPATLPCAWSPQLNARHNTRHHQALLATLRAVRSGAGAAEYHDDPPQDIATPGATSFSFAPLDLAAISPIKKGNERNIYPYPDDDTMLVKVVMRHERVYHWYKRWRRNDSCRTFLLEMRTAVETPIADDIPMALVYGVMPTTMGMGLLVEKISDANGGFAPTLPAVLASNGFDPTFRSELLRLFDALSAAHIVVWDPAPANFVCGFNRDGRHGIYLVDGYGDRQFLPRYALNRHLNARNNQNKYAELLRHLNVSPA